MKKDYVSVRRVDEALYPEVPFHPNIAYPEFLECSWVRSSHHTNNVYQAVRAVLEDLGLDQEHQGSAQWRPFRDLVHPGCHVVIKPNFVKGKHPLGEQGSVSMITHASLMRPVIDYVLLSTKRDVKITICDVPLQSSSWDEILKWSRTQELVDWYKDQGITIDLVDARREISHLNEELVIDRREFADRDPLGYRTVDLGTRSCFMPIIEHYKRFMITDYDKGTVAQHHNPKKNEYCIAGTVLDADLFINLPKLKTHRKAGITVASKNLIGMNGDKRWIAHHTERSPQLGGDEFPHYVWRDWIEWHLFAFLKRHPPVGVWLASRIRTVHRRVFEQKRALSRWVRGSMPWVIPFVRIWRGQKHRQPKLQSSEHKQVECVEWPTISREMFLDRFAFSDEAVFEHLNPRCPRIMEGSWYGNNTVWRTILDLNDIIFHADKQGVMQEQQQRKYLCIVDGVIGGEREGPMEHTPKPSRVILGGFHPLHIDYTAAWIMGFDYMKIPVIREMFKHPHLNKHGLKPENICWQGNVDVEKMNLRFYPTINWRDHIERSTNQPYVYGK